jgi:hypothetical protein
MMDTHFLTRHAVETSAVVTCILAVTATAIAFVTIGLGS